MAGTIEQKLAALDVVLHTPVSPLANYVGFVRTGNLLIVSGQVCLGADGKLIAKGKLGAGVSIEQGAAAARGCAINLLSQVKAAIIFTLSRRRSFGTMKLLARDEQDPDVARQMVRQLIESDEGLKSLLK